MKIRRAKPSDRHAIEAVHNDVHGGVFDEHMSSELAQMIEDRGVITLVAVDGDNIVGFAAGDDFIQPDSRTEDGYRCDPTTMLVTSLITNLDGDNGVCARLLDTLVPIAENEGWARVVAQVKDSTHHRLMHDSDRAWVPVNDDEGIAWIAEGDDEQAHMFYIPNTGWGRLVFAAPIDYAPVIPFPLDQPLGQAIINGLHHLNTMHGDHRAGHQLEHVDDGSFDGDLPVGQGAKGLAHRHEPGATHQIFHGH